MSSSTSKFKATPTYTFKGRTNSVTSNNHPSKFPSPNQYNPEMKSLNKSPEPSFAQSKRLEWTSFQSKQLTPGPGSHEAPSYITNGQKRSINNLRHKEIKNTNPSPGAYKNDSFIHKPKEPSFSFQKKTITPNDLIASKNLYKPSPATYEHLLKDFCSQSINFSKALRPLNVLPTKTPGPGAYDSAESFNKSVISTSSKCKLSKEKRDIDFSIGQRSPGPCTYEKKGLVNEIQKKQFTLRSRNKLQNHLEKIPGPGQYETPIIRHLSSPHIKMAVSQRSARLEEIAKAQINQPGPGSYEQVKKLPKFRSMSVYKFSKAPTTHNQMKRINSSISLGPGHYHNESFALAKYSSLPKYSIDSKTKRDIQTNKIEKSPGPTNYNPNPEFTYRSKSTHLIGKSSRANIIKHLQKNPGPGSYNLKANESLGRKFKFSKDKKKDYFQQKVKKQKSIINESYQSREQFPNPPKYMTVSPKIKFNQHKINKYV